MMSVDKRTFVRLFLLFIPVSYASYLFHEFGHWIVGEALGNDMAYSLNDVWPKTGYYIHANHDVLVLLGGPAFTILLALLSLLVLERYKTIYAYPFVFFQMFIRLFSLVFGGFSLQDESKISAILNLGSYTVAVVVLLLLILIVLKASNTLRISLKNNGYFTTMSTLGILLVIATYTIFSK
jgi:hypothetical protein